MSEVKNEFNKKEFFSAIEEVAKENLLDPKDIYGIIEDAVIKSFHSKFDPDADLDFTIDPVKEEFVLINKTKMVSDLDEVEEQYRAIEITLKDAKEIDPKAKVGSFVSEVVDFSAYSRTVAGQVRQLLTQQVRELKKAAIYSKHKSLKGEMIEVTVTTNNERFAILLLDDGTTAFMPTTFKNPKIILKPGSRVQVYVEDVLEDSKDAQIIVSNGSPRVVRRILEAEVPEIAEGIVEIIALSRLPGDRTKVAVQSLSPEVDAAGAIIGAGGSRIKGIIEKLEGERLDIINYSTDLNEFVASAISPAKVIAVLDKKDAAGKPMEGYKVIITPNRHQTLAIGRKGSNVRLTAELTKTRIDIMSIDDAKEKGIEFEWNGNVTPEMLPGIEEGIRQTYTRRPQKQAQGFGTTSNLMGEFNEDINSFNESLSFDSNFDDDAFNSNEHKDETSFDLDFSDDDLAQMQQDFGFDLSAEVEISDDDFGDLTDADFGEFAEDK